MFFVGVDLAWSSRNQTGLTIIEGNTEKGEVIYVDTLYSLDSILEKIDEIVGDNDAIVGIDAPVVVPNEEGSRIAERELNKVFRKYHAGAHPANRSRLASWSGTIRGEELAFMLKEKGYSQTFIKEKDTKGKRVFEIFPHPAIVSLFNRERILQYKAKQNRTYQMRYVEFKEYQHCLQSLENKSPALHLPHHNILNMSVRSLKGKALKEFEDRLDSIMCAYIVYFYWCHPEKCKVFGNREEGYIITPIRKQDEG